MNPTHYPGVRPAPSHMRKDLAYESRNLHRVDKLFKDYQYSDISGILSERKSGTDGLLNLITSDGVETAYRLEHKFEVQRSGLVAIEICSVDRGPGFAPGWFFTSQAAWLLSWYEPTGDIIVCNMAELRRTLLAQIRENFFLSTTKFNGTDTVCHYLSWCSLPESTHLLGNFEHTYYLDVRASLGESPRLPSFVCPSLRRKYVTVPQLVEIIRTMPASSTPVPVTHDEVKAFCRIMNQKNLLRFRDAQYLDMLPWLKDASLN